MMLMDISTHETIVRLASHVRTVILSGQEAGQFKIKAPGPDMKGFCVIASMLLHAYLREHGFNVSVAIGTFSDGVANEEHAWIVLPYGRTIIIDITTTQFNRSNCIYPEILIAEQTDAVFDYFDEQYRGSAAGRVIADEWEAANVEEFKSSRRWVARELRRIEEEGKHR